MLALTVVFSIATTGFGQPAEPKAERVATPKIGDRVVIPFGIELRAAKADDDEPKFRPPAPGQIRNAFRVYRIERVETPWVRVQSEHDGVSGWVTVAEAVPIEKAFELATNELMANPDNSASFINRALLWAEKGELDLAIADYDEAIRLDAGNATAFNNRGNLWRLKRDHDHAIADFTEAIKIDPTYAAAYNNRGIAWRTKDIDRAIADYTEAIKIDPDYFAAYNNRGNAYREKKDFDRAIADFTSAIRIHPTYAHAYANRGLARRIKNEFGPAIDDYTRAIELDARNAPAHNNLAWLRAVCPDAKYRDGPKAIESATRACELTTWKSANNIDTLAAACAEAGDFESATRWQRKAQPLFPDDETRARGSERLELYKAHKPFRELEPPEIKRPS
jgi:tetratricopeptide (TPR) repeat protein